MSAELDAFVQQLPPGEDIFQRVQYFIDEQVYPELGKAFWIQMFVLIGILTIAGILFMVGLIIRASRGRLNFIQRDGALSRLELKFVVPILWTGDIVLAFAFAVTWKIFLEKHRFTHFNGAVWFLIYLPSSISYVLLSTTVAAGAPPIRRFFGRMQYGVIWFNLIIALIVCASCVGMILPALKHADAMVNITNTYNRISGVIQDARAKQDMTVLPGIVGMLPLLEEADRLYRKEHKTASSVYVGLIVFYALVGLVPAMILSRVIMKKITRLEKNGGSPSDLYKISSMMSDHIDLPVNMDEDSHVEEVMTPTTLKLPEQPKDRPFAQLIEMKTTPFPERFQNVLEAEDQTALQRAANLRAVLKSDFKLLAIYFLILLFFFGGALFMACGGLDLLATRGDFIFGFVYFTWTFGIPCFALSCLLIRDALQPAQAAPKLSKTGDTRHSTSRHMRSFNAPMPGTIQCSQVVSVSYVGGDESQSTLQEKKHMY